MTGQFEVVLTQKGMQDGIGNSQEMRVAWQVQRQSGSRYMQDEGGEPCVVRPVIIIKLHVPT